MLALLVAAVGLSQAPADAAGVYIELGLPVPAGANGPLPAAYRPDGATADDVRRTPLRFPGRAAVLQSADALGKARKLAAIGRRELHESEVTDKGKAKLVDRQEDIAAVVLFLDEAASALSDTADKRAGERSKRWQAHAAYLAAVVALEAAHLEELNLAYGNVRSGRLPDLDAVAGQTGWRLAPADAMMSKAAVRKQDEAAREQIRKVIAEHPGTPWAALAEADVRRKPGLHWEAAAVKAPEPPKGKKPKK